METLFTARLLVDGVSPKVRADAAPRALFATLHDPLPRAALRAAGNLQTALAAGVTTVRDCGGPAEAVLALARAEREGLIRGARVVASGATGAADDGIRVHGGLLVLGSRPHRTGGRCSAGRWPETAMELSTEGRQGLPRAEREIVARTYSSIGRPIPRYRTNGTFRTHIRDGFQRREPPFSRNPIIE